MCLVEDLWPSKAYPWKNLNNSLCSTIFSSSFTIGGDVGLTDFSHLTSTLHSRPTESGINKSIFDRRNNFITIVYFLPDTPSVTAFISSSFSDVAKASQGSGKTGIECSVSRDFSNWHAITIGPLTKSTYRKRWSWKRWKAIVNSLLQTIKIIYVCYLRCQ